MLPSARLIAASRASLMPQALDGGAAAKIFLRAAVASCGGVSNFTKVGRGDVPSRWQSNTPSNSQGTRNLVSGRGIDRGPSIGDINHTRTRGLSTAVATTTYDHPATAAYDQTVDIFPSLVIGANGRIEPVGSFAEVQAEFLEPDEYAVKHLSEKILEHKVGVVAHYYMDVELQGVLTSVLKDQQKSSGNKQPMVAIADSLAMGDDAVKMCQEGAKAIACLGVDFMSESVATIMARNGFGHIPVYRLDAAPIGCSLAESAERESYRAWLETAGKDESALHVVYINTSLETKAVSNSIVPTITCTSSNVLQTILQASSQIPDIKIMYGPDTYMGNNLITMLDAILKHGEGGGADGEEPWDNVRIARDLHPGHNTASLRKLRDSIDVYPAGNCVVHHMFGAEVSAAVRRNYDDAYVSAHLEVPGEMFEIAMEKSLAGKGVVGSTADILKFISQKVTEAAEKDGAELHRLKFILGTEAGMVTSIVKSVRDILERTGSDRVECEIVFPVASDAFMTTDEAGSQSTDGLAIVPGVGGGEGCSTAGGCATCPFMKMNDLDSLIDVIDMVGANQKQGGAGDEAKILNEFLPPNRIEGRTINGVSAVDLGSQPILYMRQFMKEKSIPEELVQRITA